MKFLCVFIGGVFIATSVYGYTTGGINAEIGATCVQASTPLVCGWCASSGTPIPGNCSPTYALCVNSWQQAVPGQIFVGPDNEIVWVQDAANNIQTSWTCGDNGWEPFTTFLPSGSGDRSDGWCGKYEYFSKKDNRCHFCPDTGVYNIDTGTGLVDLNRVVMAGTGTGSQYNQSTMCQYSFMENVEYGDATGRFIFAGTSGSTRCLYDTLL